MQRRYVFGRKRLHKDFATDLETFFDTVGIMTRKVVSYFPSINKIFGSGCVPPGFLLS